MGEGTGRVVVVGAGASGLACARALAAAGRAVVVVERARGVGGRCATRRVDGQPVDFGAVFLHGGDAAFLAAVDEVPARRVPGWPRQILGSGRPCQPEAFRPGERRLAFAEGVSAFPKHLARGLDVRLETTVQALRPDGASVRLALEGGAGLDAGTVVLALATEQVRALLGTIADPPRSVRAACALLDMDRSHCCLALVAAYPEGTPVPPWDASYPDASGVLQLAANESSKREATQFLAMTYQAHPSWSRAHEEDPSWPAQLLAEAGRLLGAWAARPRLVQPHRWRYARHDRSAELSAPMLLPLDGGARVGLCGDRFAPGGGVEAAWLSGTRLAAGILGEAR